LNAATRGKTPGKIDAQPAATPHCTRAPMMPRMGAFRSIRKSLLSLSLSVGDQPCAAADVVDLARSVRQVLDRRYGTGNVFSSQLDEMVGACLDGEASGEISGSGCIVVRMAALLEIAKESEVSPAPM
jgi:hypothetical protein